MTASTNSADFDPSELAFVTRRVTDAEASAVTAVLRGVLQEESDGIRAAPERGQSAWQVSQRAIRPAVRAGQGQWRGFSA